MIGAGSGFLALLRRVEQNNPGLPRIGRSRRVADEAIRIGQDPRLAFPATEFSATESERGGVPDLRTNIFGFFGPQGALPLNTTEEVMRWTDDGEDAFVRLTDILATRFFQLFFRAWSDSHAISQHDHPDGDRFGRYVAALSGIGTSAFQDHDRFPDIARLPLVSLFGGRVRSPVRLKQMLNHYFSLPVRVEEMVPAWMEFDPADHGALGRQGGQLGRDAYLGARVRSVGEKICLHVQTGSLDDYRSFLPGAWRYEQLANLVFWYLGKTFEVDLALSLPASAIPQARLGQGAVLGWMTALPANRADAPSPDAQVQLARFALNLDAGAAQGITELQGATAA